MSSNHKNSVSGYIWKQKKFDERLGIALQQKFDLPSALASVIATKNLALDEVENFLNPTLKAILPNPFDLMDMEKAVNHIVAAILANKKITLFADYDVDGATSSALLKSFFAEIGVNAEIYIPDRILEGYGPNSLALLNLKKNGTDLVITLDCGTTSFKPLEDAKNAGLEIIVIDHHLGVLDKPDAIAVINPNRIDETFPHKNLCAAGVCFLLVVALNKKLRESGFYQNLKEPNLIQFLDLVALGTVCDVMPLTGLNRAFVTQGLKILRSRRNLGIRALCDVANLDEEPTAYHLGFVIGPRINAGGRVGTSDLGARILSTNNESEALEISHKLNFLNNERKEIEKIVLETAINNLEKNVNGFSSKDDIIFAVNNGWHQGVIGIVASRLKDLYNRPVAVIALQDKKGKASCRSIHGIDFGNAILQARLNGLLIEGGGHQMAGGFSVSEDKVFELHQFFQQLLASKVKEIVKEQVKEFHAILDLENVNMELLNQLKKLEPFGASNHRPKFIIRNLKKISAKLIGQNQEHISCVFSSLSNIGFVGNIQAVAFKAAKTPMAEILLGNSKTFDIACELNINSFMGMEKVQMLIEDILI